MADASRLNPEQAALEGLSHLCSKTCMMWGSQQLDGWLNQVLLDSRDGERHGLPPEACSEMLFLLELNKSVRALELAGVLGIPYDEAYRKIDMHDRGYSDADLARGITHVDNV